MPIDQNSHSRSGPADYYATVIDSVGDGVIVVDQERVITLCNPAAEEITGFSRRQVVGISFEKLFAQETTLLEILTKTIRTGITISDNDNVMIRTTGKVIPVGVTCYPLTLPNGENIGAILTLKDITYIRELEATIRQADRLSTLGTLAAGLAHEVKNPLGGIKGAAQLLEQELGEDSDQRECTGVILRETDRIDRIIRELLDLASPRRLKLAPVNLHRVLADILQLQKHSVMDREISIVANFDPSIPPLMADGEMLTRLFLNLILNSMEALGESGRLTVTSRVLSDYRMAQNERQSRMVAVEISDTGPGIAPEDLENIWTPFFTKRSGGTGLGLTICHKIVSEHRGQIKVESSLNHGTKFTVLLPLVQ
ncbi:two-component system sensor histidine kinase NtrB [Pelotalea chapellei]|uniref:histidine kinase n=1 Tax=Pelotalea chapellei TaxID=44671 RepID=A0ABS5UCY8_9BACT|nr:ATP-binding protein [Pelotalea chapellei]MBT1073506.1 PAS domain S-box protein [Pelotalea chapellei]